MSDVQLLDAEVFRIKRVDQASMWDGYEFGRPTRFATYFNDFFAVTVSTGAGNSEWLATETGAGTQVITDVANGIWLLTNAAADNDLISLQLGNAVDGSTGEGFLPAVGRNIYFEIRCSISDATQSDMLVGLVVTDTTPLTNANGIYFRKDDGDTQIDFETNASSVASSETNIGTMDTAFHVYGFKVTGTGSVEYFLDGVSQGTLTTIIPVTELRPTIHIQNGEAVAKSMSVDYIFVAQTRVP